jgi:hypothetical protein
MSLGYHDEGWSPVEDEAAFERMVGGRYVSDDEREDARREEIDDAHPPNMECPECGFEWWSRVIPATREQPSEPVVPDCPRCNGEAEADY